MVERDREREPDKQLNYKKERKKKVRKERRDGVKLCCKSSTYEI